MNYAEVLVALVEIYAVIGMVFAAVFVTIGIKRIDHEAGGGTIGFRLIILPAAAGLWPLLLRRWVTGGGEPPEERNPHLERVAT